MKGWFGPGSGRCVRLDGGLVAETDFRRFDVYNREAMWKCVQGEDVAFVSSVSFSITLGRSTVKLYNLRLNKTLYNSQRSCVISQCHTNTSTLDQPLPNHGARATTIPPRERKLLQSSSNLFKALETSSILFNNASIQSR